MKWMYLILALLLSIPLAQSQVIEKRKAIKGFFDFNYYRDSREFNGTTVNLLADFDGRFEYFSLTNIDSEIEASDKTDSTLYYTEQNLRWKFLDDGFLSLSLQAALQSGEENDLTRGGVMVALGEIPTFKDFFKRHKMFFNINLFPIQVDQLKGYNYQVEYFYNIQLAPELFNDRLYLSGFADQNIGPDNTIWVTEHQLGFRTFDNFFLVAEYRINEFLSKNTGWAGGIEYFLPFGD